MAPQLQLVPKPPADLTLPDAGILAGHVALAEMTAGATEEILAGDFQPPSGAPDATGAPLLAMYGDDLLRHDAAACVCAAASGRPLLTVDLKAAANEQTPAVEVVRLALRDARLAGAVAYLRQWDGCLDEDRRAAREAMALAFAHPGPVVL